MVTWASSRVSGAWAGAPPATMSTSSPSPASMRRNTTSSLSVLRGHLTMMCGERLGCSLLLCRHGPRSSLRREERACLPAEQRPPAACEQQQRLGLLPLLRRPHLPSASSKPTIPLQARIVAAALLLELAHHNVHQIQGPRPVHGLALCLDGGEGHNDLHLQPLASVVDAAPAAGPRRQGSLISGVVGSTPAASPRRQGTGPRLKRAIGGISRSTKPWSRSQHNRIKHDG